MSVQKTDRKGPGLVPIYKSGFYIGEFDELRSAQCSVDCDC